MSALIKKQVIERSLNNLYIFGTILTVFQLLWLLTLPALGF